MLLTMSEGKEVRDFHGQTIYLQEFQYGKDVFQTTTSGIVNSVSGYISNCKHLAMVTQCGK